MGRALRDGSGAMLVGAAMVVIFWAVVQMRAHDYVAATLLLVTGLAMLRAGVDLLRPTLGE